MSIHNSLQSPPSSPLPPPSPPSFLAKARHFLGALTSHAADGFEKVSDDELQSRLAICRACPSFTGTHCKECGCSCSGNKKFLNKLAWRSEMCPLGKWASGAENSGAPDDATP